MNNIIQKMPKIVQFFFDIFLTLFLSERSWQFSLQDANAMSSVIVHN